MKQGQEGGKDKSSLIMVGRVHWQGGARAAAMRVVGQWAALRRAWKMGQDMDLRRVAAAASSIGGCSIPTWSRDADAAYDHAVLLARPNHHPLPAQRVSRKRSLATGLDPSSEIGLLSIRAFA